jgi:hypothetical protein
MRLEKNSSFPKELSDFNEKAPALDRGFSCFVYSVYGLAMTTTSRECARLARGFVTGGLTRFCARVRPSDEMWRVVHGGLYLLVRYSAKAAQCLSVVAMVYVHAKNNEGL